MITKAEMFAFRAAACVFVLAVAAHAAPQGGAKADAKTEVSEARTLPGVDKQALEGYLKVRLASIKDAHKKQEEFMASEAESWARFWSGVREERSLFEVRTVRMRLDNFESMASLQGEAHPAALSDFEKLQSNLIKSFEQQQKAKVQEFFAARDKRWREFSVQVERERADFASEAEGSWQTQKASLKGPAK